MGAWDSQHLPQWDPTDLDSALRLATSLCLTVSNFDGFLYSHAASLGSGTSTIGEDALTSVMVTQNKVGEERLSRGLVVVRAQPSSFASRGPGSVLPRAGLFSI